MRADGCIDLDIRATIETDDGCRNALAADGVASPQAGGPVMSLRENVRLTTAAEKYAWVNARQIWAVGVVTQIPRFAFAVLAHGHHSASRSLWTATIDAHHADDKRRRSHSHRAHVQGKPAKCLRSQW
jgi:hypothetical protein